MTDGPLGRIYDLDEAAEYLRVSKQAVARAANRHGIGSRFGRDLRFSTRCSPLGRVVVPPNIRAGGLSFDGVCGELSRPLARVLAFGSRAA